MKKLFLTTLALFVCGAMNAQIQYTNLEDSPIVMDAQYTMDHEPGYEINLMGGNVEFYIQNYGEMMSYVACFEQGAGVVGLADENLQATITLLSANTQIGGSSSFQSNTTGDVFFPVLYYPQGYTSWGGQTGYVGFKFTNAGNTYYGWMKIKVDNTTANNPIITLYGYAYQTTPNTAILAGDKGLSSIANVENNTNISVYPNPVANTINVKGTKNIERITISNVSGQEIMNVSSPKQQINVSSLDKGVYFINIYSNGTVKTEKFVKK